MSGPLAVCKILANARIGVFHVEQLNKSYECVHRKHKYNDYVIPSMNVEV